MYTGAVARVVDRSRFHVSHANVNIHGQHRLASMIALVLLAHKSSQASTSAQVSSRFRSRVHRRTSQGGRKLPAPRARWRLGQFRMRSGKVGELVQPGKLRQWRAYGRMGTSYAAHVEQQMLHNARGDKQKMLKLYEELKKRSAAEPDDVSLKLACADALVSAIRIETNINGLTCHFSRGKPEVRKMDTSVNRAFWAKWAPTADKLMREIEQSVGRKTFAKDAYMVELALEACMYRTGAKGIIAAVLSGSATFYIGKLRKFAENHLAWDGNQADIYAGATFVAAPWPIHDMRKAAFHFKRAAETAPYSRRNHYFDGVGRFASGDYHGARLAMERALREPCVSYLDRDICAFVTREAVRTIQMLKDEGY